MWTLAYGYHEDLETDARLRSDARGRDGGVRQVLAKVLARAIGGPFSLINSEVA